MTAIGTSATLLVAAGMGQTLGDLLVLAAVLGLVACGYQQGLFFAILMLFHALAAVVASLAFAEPLAGWLVAVDMPKAYAFAAAALLGAVIPAVGIRLAIGAAVPQDAVRFEPLVDKIGGGAIGAMAGVIVAGGVLILMSLAPLPDSLVIDSSKLRFDMGKRMLQSFVRCVEFDPERRRLLLEGEPWKAVDKDDMGRPRYPLRPEPPEPPADGSPAPPFELPPTGLWSEPFADRNGNKTWDQGEPFLDDDGNGVFSRAVQADDLSGNQDREVGLLDRYATRQWEKWRVNAATWDDLELPVDAPATEEGEQAVDETPAPPPSN